MKILKHKVQKVVFDALANVEETSAEFELSREKEGNGTSRGAIGGCHKSATRMWMGVATVEGRMAENAKGSD